jgi:FHA domain
VVDDGRRAREWTSEPSARDTREVVAHGRSRQRLAEVLNAAFAQGLLSERTHAHRLGLLYGPPLVDQQQIVGDLALRGDGARRRTARRAWSTLALRLRSFAGLEEAVAPPMLLSLEGSEDDVLLLGRSTDCDVVLAEPNVSRRHAQLTFRDGGWLIQDLRSTNGTFVNGERVGRTALRAGDIVQLGRKALVVD